MVTLSSQLAFATLLHVVEQGLTEVPGTVLTLTPEDHVDPRASRLTSAGKPYPGVTVRLLDEAGQRVWPGATGRSACERRMQRRAIRTNRS